MAPAAVTHANDMSQRHVPLAATVQSAGTLTVSAPAVPELAPPTYYMLFVLNDAGVPSVAKFIRLKLGRADLPPAQEPPPDTTAPETSIASGPSQTTTSPSATFSFSSSEPSSSFECRIDTGHWASCVSPTGYTDLSPGPHTFAARATDPAGNTRPTPATWDWTVVPVSSDTVAPESTIVTGPPVTTASTSATFDFVSSEPDSTFECLLDAGDWTPCASPTDYFFLTTASHAFYLRATDAAGNTDETPARWGWAITGTTAPPASEPARGRRKHHRRRWIDWPIPHPRLDPADAQRAWQSGGQETCPTGCWLSDRDMHGNGRGARRRPRGSPCLRAPGGIGQHSEGIQRQAEAAALQESVEGRAAGAGRTQEGACSCPADSEGCRGQRGCN